MTTTQRTNPGSRVRLTVQRDGSELDFNVTLGERPAHHKGKKIRKIHKFRFGDHGEKRPFSFRFGGAKVWMGVV